ncbi:MAG TPA: GNAT family N-acetyltransferase [Candidatus Dormibacteraeota bacterium]|nr:GNAT family N-acetyltransferase [Candidatus Dormibacteraeota bacterium]
MATWIASSDDLADVTRLMLGFRDWWGRSWPDEETFARGIERLLADDNTDFLLAAVDGSPPAGVVALRYRYGVWQDAPDCCLEDLFVEESARRDGLGSELVAAAIERAKERGCRRIELDVNDANAPASALYKLHGFDSFVEELGGHNRLMRLYF